MYRNSIRVLLTIIVTTYALSANAVMIFTDRTTFMNAVSGTVFIDDFESPDYDLINSAADMKALSAGGIGYESTFFSAPDWNLVSNNTLCWGCNGSGQILLDDTTFGGNGVSAFGVDILVNSTSPQYDAGVTFGDGSTAVFSLAGYDFFGIIDTSLLISSIHFGPNGFDTTSSGSLVLDNVTIAGSASVPEPTILALLGIGIVGLGFTRKRRS